MTSSALSSLPTLSESASPSSTASATSSVLPVLSQHNPVTSSSGSSKGGGTAPIETTLPGNPMQTNTSSNALPLLTSIAVETTTVFSQVPPTGTSVFRSQPNLSAGQPVLPETSGASPSGIAANTSGSRVKTTVLVGAAVGGVVIILLVILCYIVVQRQRLRRRATWRMGEEF